MFYSQDLLYRRNGRFAAIWLLATSSGRSRRQSVTNKEVATINIPRTCAEIIVPPAPLSLRLTAALLVGLVRALARQSQLLLVECHSTWSRILATPWITSPQGFDPLISAAATMSNAHAITLPWDTPLEYLGLPVDVDMATSCGSSGQLEHWRLLGWLGPAEAPRSEAVPITDQTASAGSFTSSWSSLSIPEPRAHRQVPSSTGPLSSSPGPHSRVLAPLLVDDALPLVHSQDSFDSGAEQGDEVVLDVELGSSATPDFLFDGDGNLQFVSAAGSDERTEVLAQLAPSSADTNAAALGMATAPPLHADDGHVPKRGHSETAGGALHRAAKRTRHDLDGSSIHTAQAPHGDPARLLDEIERDIAHRWEHTASSGAAAAARHARADPDHTRGHGEPAHVPQVAALWGRSCFWDRDARTRATAALCKRVTLRIQQRAAALASVHSLPGDQAASRLLGPVPPTGGFPEHDRSPSPLGDDGVSVIAAGESDVELGRGDSPGVALADDVSDSGSLDIRLDIPWLNPAILAESRRLQSAAATPSLLAEPSGAAEPHQPSANSRQSTPASRVPSLDPPSSDDGLDIQPFDLAAQHLDAGAAAGHGLGERGLDSFLDASFSTASPSDDAHGAPVAGMTREASCFCQYVLAKNHSAGADRVLFGGLLEPPFRSPRVAARAFVDLLQLASCSVFGVEQEAPYAEIVICIQKQGLQ